MGDLEDVAAAPAARGFFTDVTLCIGCKACEVACKQWNQLPDDGMVFTGMSYDNTGALGASPWRHVAFIEKEIPVTPASTVPPDALTEAALTKFAWMFNSDVCKHCVRAGCLEACPTGSIVRTEFGSVYIQPDICNGCGYCISACPFGVIDRREDDGRAWKCTLCYDRLKADMEPACAKACPTDSILFGEVAELRQHAADRVAELHARGEDRAYLYGDSAESQPGTEGVHAFFLLVDRPEVYNLPPDPVIPTKSAGEAWVAMAKAAAGLLVVAFGAALVGRAGGRR